MAKKDDTFDPFDPYEDEGAAAREVENMDGSIIIYDPTKGKSPDSLPDFPFLVRLPVRDGDPMHAVWGFGKTVCDASEDALSLRRRVREGKAE